MPQLNIKKNVNVKENGGGIAVFGPNLLHDPPSNSVHRTGNEIWL